MKNLRLAVLLLASLLVTSKVAHAEEFDSATGFVSLLDGKSMNGWKLAEENPLD